MSDMEKIVTVTAPINIAVIKYWGKRDEELILPLNDSISFTLSQDHMCAKTTVCISPKFLEDKFFLNGKQESMTNPRIMNCLQEVRRLVKCRGESKEILDWKIHIVSENNFPTAAGLASSAAGYACLVFALGKLFGLECELSSVARLGSGSACRSLYGGLVMWNKGIRDDGQDSIAKPIGSVDCFGKIHVVICVANDAKKKVGSTEGMRRSWLTSALMKYRIEKSVLERTSKMMEAIGHRDWRTFCDLTMKDSNEMHAVCLDTFPPCVYMNDTSNFVSNVVHSYNDMIQKRHMYDKQICYTFDAGPNACLFIPECAIEEVGSVLLRCFPQELSTNNPQNPYWSGLPISNQAELEKSWTPVKHSIKYFIHTTIGDGPCVVDSHLFDPKIGA